MAVKARQINNVFLRPMWSDKSPKKGAPKNWATEKIPNVIPYKTSRSKIEAELGRSEPLAPKKRGPSTGNTTPIPIISIMRTRNKGMKL